MKEAAAAAAAAAADQSTTRAFLVLRRREPDDEEDDDDDEESESESEPGRSGAREDIVSIGVVGWRGRGRVEGRVRWLPERLPRAEAGTGDWRRSPRGFGEGGRGDAEGAAPRDPDSPHPGGGLRAGRLECEMARGQDGLTDVAQETRAGACRFFLMSCGCGCVWGVLRGSSFSLRPSSPSPTQLFLPLQICLLVAVGSEALRERGRARLKTGREKREGRRERREGKGEGREGEEREKSAPEDEEEEPEEDEEEPEEDEEEPELRIERESAMRRAGRRAGRWPPVGPPCHQSATQPQSRRVSALGSAPGYQPPYRRDKYHCNRIRATAYHMSGLKHKCHSISAALSAPPYPQPDHIYATRSAPPDQCPNIIIGTPRTRTRRGRNRRGPPPLRATGGRSPRGPHPRLRVATLCATPNRPSETLNYKSNVLRVPALAPHPRRARWGRRGRSASFT